MINKIRARTSKEDRIFYTIVYTLLFILTLVVIYPVIYIISASFSSADAVSAGRVILFPVDFSLEGYEAVFADEDVWIGFKNSIIYTFVGTVVNVSMTLLAAYPLARADLPFRGKIMFLFTFTMLFSGGMIPNYILLQNLGMLNSMSALIIPGAISAYNMIITRTFIQSNVPKELLEASQIDGCSDFRFFFQMVIPLCKAVIAVITLYYAVGHWNAYFNAFLYLNDADLYPLQLILRDILVANNIDPSQILDPELMEAKAGLADLLKYSLIVVSTAPIMVLYPFIQKYFVKGVMIGSVKG